MEHPPSNHQEPPIDEQRKQAYVSLIAQLLACPQGQEQALLQAQSELVDAGLVATMEQVATDLENQGQGNAGWLRQFAAQLAQALGANTESAPSPATASEDAARFLLETLQLVLDQQGNPQQIYPIWAQQQAQFNAELLALIPTVVPQILAQSGEQQPLIAAVLGEFGNLMQQFPLGTRWLNLELAIAAYQQSLSVMTQAAMPVDWATTMMNLATAYKERIRGDKAQNIEAAIAAYQQSLSVMTQAAMPIEWAQTMNNLANAYSERIRGDKAQNIEDAIAAYQQSLSVMTQAAMPVDWATTMMNLATAYKERIRGDKAQNIEAAIAAYQQSLSVMTQAAMPVEWAQTMMNLATAYKNRIRGDKAQNIEDAIAAYQQSLSVMTQAAMPVDWAQTMMNLANAYYSRIRGDKAQNIEDAIAAYQQSLSVRTPAAMPVDWAQTMMNLANAYKNRIRGDKAQNIEDAIAAYQQALTVLTADALPDNWALAQANLAATYRNRVQGERLENLRVAINAYQGAAERASWLSRRLAYQEEAADTQYELGVALTQQGQWYAGLAQLDACLQTYRQVGNRLARADALQQIARNHYLMSNFDKAGLYFRDALRIYQAEESSPGEAACRAGLGRLLLRLNFVDEAIAELRQACHLYRQLQDEARLAEVNQVYALAEKVREKQPL